MQKSFIYTDAVVDLLMVLVLGVIIAASFGLLYLVGYLVHLGWLAGGG